MLAASSLFGIFLLRKITIKWTLKTARQILSKFALEEPTAVI